MSPYLSNLCCFVVKLVLSQFRHFCVEKKLPKNCQCGEKMINIMYEKSPPRDSILQPQTLPKLPPDVLVLGLNTLKVKKRPEKRLVEVLV